MKITGKIVGIDDVQQFTDTFRKQDFYLDCSYYEQGTGRKFDNILKLQVINSKINELAKYEIDERVTVHFNPQGKFYQNKDNNQCHLQNLTAYKFE